MIFVLTFLFSVLLNLLILRAVKRKNRKKGEDKFSLHHHPTKENPTPPPPPPPPPPPSQDSHSEPACPPCPPTSLLTRRSFTFEELTKATDDFSNQNLIGKGGFGYVHKGLLPNGNQIAVKQLISSTPQTQTQFHNELELTDRLHHRNIISLVGYSTNEAHELFLAYEFVPNNTLHFHLHRKKEPILDWPTRQRIAMGTAKGLAYLHEDCQPKIIHRDIKASNILLDFNFEAKIADFGLAKCFSDNNSKIFTRVMGTYGYLDPEYADSGQLSEKLDVFSFGVVLLELITGRKAVDFSILDENANLVIWARPLLKKALVYGIFDDLIDPRLQNGYNRMEMLGMIVCAAICVGSASRRPRMSQVVRGLEGNLDGLVDKRLQIVCHYKEIARVVACAASCVHHSSMYPPKTSSDEFKKLKKMTFNYDEKKHGAIKSDGGWKKKFKKYIFSCFRPGRQRIHDGDPT